MIRPTAQHACLCCRGRPERHVNPQVSRRARVGRDKTGQHGGMAVVADVHVADMDRR